MPNEVIARQYGRAYYDAASEEQAFGTALAQLEELASVLRLPEVHHIWSHPLVSQQQKLDLAVEFLSGQLMPLNKRFIALLLSKKRERLLDEVIGQLHQIDREERGVAVAILASAQPLEADAEQQLVARLKKRHGKEIELQRIIDPSLLGGFSCRVGDVVYDGTLKRRLERMREYLLPQFRA